jgi:hypothetical protein
MGVDELKELKVYAKESAAGRRTLVEANKAGTRKASTGREIKVKSVVTLHSMI